MEILERENGVETLIDNQDRYKVYEGLIYPWVCHLETFSTNEEKTTLSGST